jgi:hypothetical protein
MPGKPVEARYGRLHNFSMTAVALAMVVLATIYLLRGAAPGLNTADPRVVLFIVLGIAMAYYGVTGLRRGLDRGPQVVIDDKGIALGFGRNWRFAWDDVQWVKLHRIAIRPQLHVGIAPEAFVAANLRLTMWNLDDALKPIRGMPTAMALRDNGLDTRASAMLDAVRSFRPDLVRS